MINRFRIFTTSRTAKIFRNILLLSVLFNFIHVFNMHQAHAQNLGQTLEEIRRQAEEAEARLDKQLIEVKAKFNSEQYRAQLEKQKAQIRKQFLDLLNDEEKYKQALANPGIPQEQKDLLRRFKINPQELDKFIDEQSNPEYLAQQRRLQIRQKKEEAEQRAKIRALKSRLR